MPATSFGLVSLAEWSKAPDLSSGSREGAWVHCHFFWHLFDRRVCKNFTHGETRTRNLRFRRPTPYPLGHAGCLHMRWRNHDLSKSTSSPGKVGCVLSTPIKVIQPDFF